MNIKKKFLRSAIALALLSSVTVAEAVPPVVGQFGLPYDEGQLWTACFSVGWVPYGDQNAHQYHMQYYSVPAKYHMGEDWNGKCGGSTDEGAPLLAIADGEVVFLDNSLNGTVSGQGKRLYVRYSFPYAKVSGGVMTFDSALLHLQGMGMGITWTGSGTGSVVTKGQTIAYLGKTGTPSAHLHWEAQTDLTIPLGINPYQNPLTKSHALRYRAPSLIVDDHRDLRGYSIGADGFWHNFTMQGNAPSSTMYVLRSGQRKSLKNAIAAGWIPPEGVIHENGGGWYYRTDVDTNFFENGKQYAFKALVPGLSFYVLVPRNGFQQDRARLDMIHVVENDSRFVNVLTETYGHDPNWDPSWEIHWMAFSLSSGGTAYVNQITYKANPLIRNTAYYDPGTSQWTNWVWYDWNKLY